jgi:hypothetical protein
VAPEAAEDTVANVDSAEQRLGGEKLRLGCLAPMAESSLAHAGSAVGEEAGCLDAGPSFHDGEPDGLVLPQRATADLVLAGEGLRQAQRGSGQTTVSGGQADPAVVEDFQGQLEPLASRSHILPGGSRQENPARANQPFGMSMPHGPS